MSNPKWTVLFLVHAVDDQSRYYSEQLFTELLQTDPSDDVRIFVLRNTYDYHDNTDTHAYLWEIATETRKPTEKGNASVANDGGTPEKKRRMKKRVYPEDIGYKKGPNPKSFGKINFGNPETLGDIFFSISEYVGVDNKVMLFTWDHGYAFGIFDPTEYDSKEARPIKSAPDTDMLMVRELARAIEKSFKKVNILIMMNCWMQSIETNCQLQDRTNILISPESSIDWLGYDYISIINKLISNPSDEQEATFDQSDPHTEKYQKTTADPEAELAKFIIKSTIAKYKNPLYENAAIKKEDLIIAATRPQEYFLEPIKKAIKDLAIKLKDVVHEKKEQIASARKNTIELTDYYGGGGRPWCFIDLLQLVENFGKYLVFDDVDVIIEMKNKFKALFMIDEKTKSFIIEKYIGENLMREGHGGISICFPNNLGFINGNFYKNFYYNDDKTLDKEMQYKIAFAKAVNEWPEFVDAAIKTGEIKMDRDDKNYFLNITSNVNIDKGAITLNGIMAKCQEETDLGTMSNFAFPNRNFLLNVNLGLNILNDNFRIDSLMIQSTSFDENGVTIPTIGRGAGGGKQQGAGRGGGKQQGAGGSPGKQSGPGKQLGAGGGKQQGAGGGQLIEPFALEKKEDIVIRIK